MIRLSRWLVPCFTLVIVSFAFVAAQEAESPHELITRADQAYMTRHLRESMTEALGLYEAVVPDLEALSERRQAYVLNRLSQLCYEATMFDGETTSEDEVLFENGKAYGFRSLRLNEDFVAHESEGLKTALAHVTDPAALHWTANNWGMICGIHPIQGLTEQSSVLALFSRCIELDRGFWGGSAASALGSLLIMLPGWLGGDDEAGLSLVEESIEMDPSYLNNHIILAEYWGFIYNFLGQLNGVRDAELIERETAIVLEQEVGDWPFWNRQAKAAAERLLERLRDFTD